MLPRRLLPVSVNVFKFNGSDKSSPYEVMLTVDVNVAISLARDDTGHCPAGKGTDRSEGYLSGI